MREAKLVTLVGDGVLAAGIAVAAGAAGADARTLNGCRIVSGTLCAEAPRGPQSPLAQR
jgi:hypothetical protein